MPQEIPAGRLDWLRGETAAWVRAGVLDGDAAAAVLERYRPGRRTSVVRLISVLGAAFVGVGLVSLVASNLDQLSPLVRFLGITAVWIASVVVAEVLLRREAPSARDDTARDDAARSTSIGVGGARLVAAAAYGATVFQAAQSLQVPAYSPLLLGCWSGGSLAYAYACRGVGPLLVGMATLVGWYAWVVGEASSTPGGVAAALLVGGVVATALAGLHEPAPRRHSPLAHFAPAWSYSGALVSLVALFMAALPGVAREGADLSSIAVAGLVAAVVVAAVSGALRGTQVLRECVAVVAMLSAGLLLIAWSPVDGGDELSGAELARAVVSTAVYLAAAVWFAVVGAVRDRPQLTNLATAALVVFVVVQSFGVFSTLLSGAALFLVLGVVLIGGATAADRGRRRLIAEVTE